MLTSPFKFLDSYSLADRDIFFGRNQEITGHRAQGLGHGAWGMGHRAQSTGHRDIDE
jgi:hypothetical protein